MIQVLIADDEPKIRRGLAQAAQWEQLGMEVCGFAANGEEAIDKVRELEPDICLVDICMPIINGLDLIEKIHVIKPEAICIVITGHDEFAYAQKAVTLGVFDFLLKPVNESKMMEALARARDTIERHRRREERLEKAEQMLRRNMPLLRERFLLELLDGSLSEAEIEEYAGFHGMDIRGKTGLACIKIQDASADYKALEWNRQLLHFALQNIVEELTGGRGGVYTVFDSCDWLFAFALQVDEVQWNSMEKTIETTVHSCLELSVHVNSAVLDNIRECSFLYSVWKEEAEHNLSAIVARAKECIEKNYGDWELSVQVMADSFAVNPSYLSRIFKQEMGINLVEYMTKLRIHRAVVLLETTDLLIYEIADKVGYKSQHYFCAAFKKVLGVAPTEYRQKM